MDDHQADIEKQKLALDERRVQIEERQARHAFWTRLGIVIPVVAALIAFGASVLNQRLDARDALSLQEKKAKDDFELKVAEIVMDSETPFGVRNRAIALGEIFSERLGERFGHNFDPEDASSVKARTLNQQLAAKKELLILIAEHPGEREQIVSTWHTLFPDDEWVQTLQ